MGRNKQYSDRELLEDVAKVYHQAIESKPLTAEKYREHGSYDLNTVTNRFGSWKKVKRQVGAKQDRPKQYSNRVEDEQLVEDVWKVMESTGEGQDLKIDDYNKEGKFTYQTLRSHGFYWSDIKQKAENTDFGE